MRKKYLKRIIYSLILFFLFWFLFWPLKAFVEKPGDATNIQPMVKIDGKKELKNNQFMVTSVKIGQLRPFSYLLANYNRHATIVSEKDLFGNQNNSEYNKVQNIYMKSSINNAIINAYHKANQQVKIKNNGVYVLQVYDGSDFHHKIKPGDLIKSINGKSLNSSQEYIKYVKSLPKQSKMKLKLNRSNQLINVSGKKVKIAKDFYGIGIGMIDDIKIKEKPKVTINPGELGGPSGGLMFSLQVFSQLTDQQYGYNKIAGTGTIDEKGNVGEIGGIDKKIIAANKSGAKIFFTPYVKPTKSNLALEENQKTNYQMAVKTAKKYAPNMKIVPVKTFDDAIKYLKEWLISTFKK